MPITLDLGISVAIDDVPVKFQELITRLRDYPPLSETMKKIAEEFPNDFKKLFEILGTRRDDEAGGKTVGDLNFFADEFPALTLRLLEVFWELYTLHRDVVSRPLFFSCLCLFSLLKNLGQ